MFFDLQNFSYFDNNTVQVRYYCVGDSSLPEIGATLNQLLDIAGLLKAYNEFHALFSEAEDNFFNQKNQAALNTLYKIWMGPHFIPALLLYECFYHRELILPSWEGTGYLYLQNMTKKSGGTRPIIIPNKRTRICMGAVNSILQSSCRSWSFGTTGFRPGAGTHFAINLLAEQIKTAMRSNRQVFILSFDIQKAFNSVQINNLFHLLNLKGLPHSIKALIWKWHHTPVKYSNKVVSPFVNGLAQGFAYSPTLFAWYCDVLIVRNSSFIAYADNFAGVFYSMEEAVAALQKVNLLLQNTGLCINQSSVSFYHHSLTESQRGNGGFGQTAECSLNSTPNLYPWLGHAVSLPTAETVYNVYQQKAFVSKPVVISLDMWQHMLRDTNWVQKVHNYNWRNIS